MIGSADFFLVVFLSQDIMLLMHMVMYGCGKNKT